MTAELSDSLDVEYLFLFPAGLKAQYALPYLAANLVQFSQRARAAKPDWVIFTHISTLFLYPLFNRFKKLAFIQGAEWLFPSSSVAVQSILKYISLYIYSRINVLVMASSSVYSDFQRSGGLVPLASASMILYPVGSKPAGTTATLQNPASLSSWLDRRCDIICIVRNSWVKRAPYTVEVLNHLSNLSESSYHLSLVDASSGSLPPNLFSYLPQEVEVLPRLSRAHLYDRLCAAKIFFCFSAYEGFGLPLVEAMHAGCISFSSCGCGSSSLLSDAYPELIISRLSSPLEAAKSIHSLLQKSREELCCISQDMRRVAAQFYCNSITERASALSRLRKILSS